MANFSLLADFITILVTALVFGLLAKKLKQPVIIGYIVGGVLVGMLLGRFLGKEVSQLADIGVALLMFTLGLEFSFTHLKRVFSVTVYGAIAQIVLSTVFGLLVLPLLGVDFYQALFIAAAFSLSSTAVAVKILTERGETDTIYGEILIGWLLIQDLAVVPMMVLLPAVGQIVTLGGQGLLSQLGVLLLSVVKSAVVLYIIFLLGKRSVPFVLDRVAKINSRELFLVAVILLVFCVSGLTAWAGLSFATGAFLAGFLVSETSQNHAVFAEVRPLRDLLSIVFFVILGMLFPVSFLLSHLTIVIVLSLIVMLFKFLLVAILVFYFGYHAKTALGVGSGLISVGEFAFVLGRFGLNAKLLTVADFNLLLGVALVSMVVSPAVMYGILPIYHILKETAKKYLPEIYDNLFLRIDKRKGEPKELDLENHVVICGHGRVGKHISRILTLARKPFIVVDFNQKVVNDLKSQAQPVIYGDPTDYEVLDYAQVDKARALVIATPDRHSQEMIIENALKLNKNVIIICRSHFDEDKQRLYALGARSIVQPEFEAGLYMGGQLLRIFGFSAEEIGEYLRKVRKEG